MNKCFWCEKRIWFWEHKYFENDNEWKLHLKCYPDYKYKTTFQKYKDLKLKLFYIEQVPTFGTDMLGIKPVTFKEYNQMKAELESLERELDQGVD